MVAASATAILIDINLSTFARSPFGAVNSLQTRKMPDCRSAHAFLTACVNQAVSTRGRERVSMGEERKCCETK